jgi:hypothetical protein
MRRAINANKLDIEAGQHYAPQSTDEHYTLTAMTIEAAREYDRAIAEGDASLDDLLNASVLYWQCTDPGFLALPKCDSGFIKTAGTRYVEVLDIADQCFPGFPEIQFWRRYFDFISLGECFPIDDCRQLVAMPLSSQVPYFYLYSSTNGGNYQDQALQLLSWCQKRTTLKNCYISSVIESTQKMGQWGGEEKMYH